MEADHIPGSDSRMQDPGRDAPALPTGVVTFLLSDVAGSTRLWEGDEQAAAAAIARHYELLDGAITRHGGLRPVEQGEGDSVVGAFARASDAVAAALDAQLAFASEVWPPGVDLRIRIALHSGEAQLRDAGNYFGPAVIRCARLRAIAHPGQILVSDTTRALVAGPILDEVTWRDLGSLRLKDLGEPQRVWQLVHSGLADDFPPVRSLEAVSHNLPVQLTSFVGREAELTGLAAVLGQQRLVTLTGAGGCGKTRLALHAAADRSDDHGDGVRWVELGPVSDPALVPYVVARTFGLREEEGGRPVTDTLCEQLAGTDALVVLDNCEHVIDACAEFAERLLVAAPRVRIMATSREPLGVAGEVTWRVPVLDEAAAFQLFVERAAAARPGFAPANGEGDEVSQICARLDGIPLAIELAAARIRMMSPARIAAALDDRFRLLTGGGRSALPRQQTLETSVAWSHDLLDEAERTLLRRLSVFAGGFTLEAAEQVGGAGPLDPYTVFDLLTRLVDKSLVSVELASPPPDGGRYRLLETIRLYAGQKLADSGEADATRDRQLATFLDLVETAEPNLAFVDGPAWLDRLEVEHDNIRASLEWADATGAYEPFLRLTAALTLFWEYHGHMQAGGRWCSRALARDEGPSVVRARALWGAAHMALYGGRYADAHQLATAALEMARQLGDTWAEGRALNLLGLFRAWMDGEPGPARADLARSIELGERHGDNWAVVDGWKMTTLTWILQEDHDGLAEALGELRAVAERLGSKFFIGWCHICVGWAGVRHGDLDAAHQAFQAALGYDEELGGAATAGVAAVFLGEIEILTGRVEAAEARFRRMLERASTTGDWLALPFVLTHLARLAVGRGAPAEARDLVEPLIAEHRAAGLPLVFPCWAHTVLATAFAAEGRHQEAEAVLGEVHGLAVRLGNHWLAARADHHLGRLAREMGDPGRAERHHHAALAHDSRFGLLPGVADSFGALAALAADHESYGEATRLLAAAATLRNSLRLVHLPVDQAAFDAEVARARDGIGDEMFEAWWKEGAALSADEAVAYATRARGERRRPSSGWESLTPTEVEVVKLAATGLTNPEIGERLFIGRGTVKTHLTHVFTKLGVTSRAELAAQAVRRGL